METLVIKVPDYFQEKLPESQWTYHFEVRRNYGSNVHPNWQTIKYAQAEQEARDWAKVN